MRFSSRLCVPFAALSVCLLTSGCSGSEAARAFGLERSLPDEYTVTTRAPLSMPPSSELSAPSGSPDLHPQDESMRMQALETLSPDVALKGSGGSGSAGQSALLSEADEAASQTDKGELGKADQGYVDALLFWKGGGAGSVVDGAAENHRLKTNAALGKSPTNGATPTTRNRR
ncbi:DUF3035 domain-containing protein [Acetobacter sp. AN02]|uniref:DUF3035 domain-containing protein n=1 Tax=Acetobacter sp. AN02 TaxID=2894186 RepID=UPI0024346307|nr:DUF3035 domain-containing protein [Acetobacter sp. AN02]MDG6094145.1 DUF3035 domain-containing protein [Acetobacter sp. AN02]